MKSRIHLFGLVAVLSLGSAACSPDRGRAGADRGMEGGSAGRMATDDARRHDAQRCTGAAADPLRGATSGERAGNAADDNTRAGSANRTGDRGQASAMDRQCVTKTAAGNIAEVEIGRLAQDKASSEHVKEFGKRMVEYRANANEKLQRIAGGKGIDIPSETDAKHKAAILRLSGLSGAQFDRACTQEMLKAHKEDVAHFRKGSNQLEDPGLKSFASATLPKLQEHLNHLQSMRGNMQEQAGRSR